MGAISAILAGAGQVAEKEHARTIDARLQRRGDWADILKFVITSDAFPSESKQRAMQDLTELYATDPHQRLKTEFQDRLADWSVGAVQMLRPDAERAQAADLRGQKATLGVPELIPPPTGVDYAQRTGGAFPGQRGDIQIPPLVDMPGITSGGPVGGLIPEAVATPPPPGVEQPRGVGVQPRRLSLGEFAAQTGEDPNNRFVVQKYRQWVATQRKQDVEFNRDMAELKTKLRTTGEIKREEGERILARLQENPAWNRLDDRTQMALTGMALGLGSMSSQMFGVNLRSTTGTVTGNNVSRDIALDTANNPIDRSEGTTYKVLYDPRTGEQMAVTAVTEAARPAEWVANERSQYGYSRVYRNPRGDMVDLVDAVPPGYMHGRITQSVDWQTNAQGETFPVVVQSVSKPYLPQAVETPPPPGEGLERTGQPAEPVQAPQPGAGVISKGAEPVGQRVVPATTRMLETDLIRAYEEVKALHVLGQQLIKDEGITAKAKGWLQRVQAAAGYNPIAQEFIISRDRLRPLFTKTLGGEVGNLSAFEQEWGIKGAGDLGMSAEAYEYNYQQVMRMLRIRLRGVQAVIAGEPIPDDIKHLVRPSGSVPVFGNADAPPPGAAEATPFDDVPEDAVWRTDDMGNYEYSTDGEKTWHPVQQ